MKTKSKIDLTYKIVVASLLIVYALTIFILLGWGLMQSFRFIDDYTYNGALSLPTKIEGFESEYFNALKFGNYKQIMDHFYCEAKVSYFTMFDAYTPVGIDRGQVGLFGLILNTLYMAIVCSFAQVFITYLVAYLCAKYRFKFSTFIYGLVIFMMTVPTVGTQPATVTLLQNLNLFGRYGGMLLMRCCFGGMYFLVFYGFFEGLPDSYVEAAEIDGASQFNILLTIIIPLGIKTILTITLILFVANWNDYSMSFIYMPAIPTLAFAVYELAHVGYRHSSLTGDVYKIAGCMILAIPITVIFAVFRDKIMGDISAGGLKG